MLLKYNNHGTLVSKVCCPRLLDVLPTLCLLTVPVPDPESSTCRHHCYRSRVVQGSCCGSLSVWVALMVLARSQSIPVRRRDFLKNIKKQYARMLVGLQVCCHCHACARLPRSVAVAVTRCPHDTIAAGVRFDQHRRSHGRVQPAQVTRTLHGTYHARQRRGAAERVHGVWCQVPGDPGSLRSRPGR